MEEHKINKKKRGRGMVAKKVTNIEGGKKKKKNQHVTENRIKKEFKKGKMKNEAKKKSMSRDTILYGTSV